MKLPAILKKRERWHGEDREIFVTDEKEERGEKHYKVELVDGAGYWVFEDRIEFTDQQEIDL